MISTVKAHGVKAHFLDQRGFLNGTFDCIVLTNAPGRQSTGRSAQDVLVVARLPLPPASAWLSQGTRRKVLLPQWQAPESFPPPSVLLPRQGVPLPMGENQTSRRRPAPVQG